MTRIVQPVDEQRVREIAREEAIKAVVAASRVQAGHAAGEVIDRYRVSANEVEACLDGTGGPVV